MARQEFYDHYCWACGIPIAFDEERKQVQECFCGVMNPLPKLLYGAYATAPPTTELTREDSLNLLEKSTCEMISNYTCTCGSTSLARTHVSPVVYVCTKCLQHYQIIID